MASLARDLRYALRSLRNAPAFTLAVLVTLALGIGASTAIFSVIEGVLLRPLPYRDGDALVHVTQPAALAKVPNVGLSPLEVEDLRTRARSFDGVVEYHSMTFNLIGGEEPERVQTGVVTAGFFQTLGVSPLLGRLFEPGEDAVGAPPLLLLSYRYWQRHLGGDPQVIGRSFTMNDRVHTVVGVLPNLPQYPQENDVYMPVSSCPYRVAARWAQTRAARGLSVFARLKAGVRVEAANAELAGFAGQWHQELSGDYPKEQGLGLTAIPLREQLTKNARPTLLFLLAAAAFLLLIVCANVANLTLARTARRERELAVRAALGASRGQLLQQLVTESVVLAVAGGALGLLLSAWGLDLLIAFTEKLSNRAVEIRLNGLVLAFNLGVSVLTGLVVGALPAVPGRTDLATGLKDGAGATARPSHLRARSLLVVAQVAVSCALLIGAGLFLRSLHALSQVDAGIDVQNVLTARVSLDFTHYGGQDQTKTRQFADRLVERLRQAPGANAVGIANAIPLGGNTPFTAAYQVEGQPPAEGQPPPAASIDAVTPGWFAALGVPLVSGRLLTEADRNPEAEVVVINQSLARHQFAGRDPLGRRISFDGGKHWNAIVGVVGDSRQQDLQSPVVDEVLAGFALNGFGDLRLFVRSQAGPATLARQIREAVHEIDPLQPITAVQPLAQQRDQALAPHKLMASLLGLFGALALAITAAGLIGLIAYSVSRRTQEIGIRLALGAAPREVLAMLVGQGLALVVAGLGLGLLGALLLGQLVQGLLFGVEPIDPATFASVPLLFLAVGALACTLPARRATGIEPMIALRSS